MNDKSRQLSEQPRLSAGSDASRTPLQPWHSWAAWALLLIMVYGGTSAIDWKRTLLPDELWAAITAGEPLGWQLAALRHDATQGPLFYLLQRGWFALAGYTDSAAKALMLLLNSATIALSTRLAWLATRYWRAAAFLMAAVYLRISGIAVMARMYPLILFWMVLLLLVYEQWRQTSRNRWLVAWTVVAILLIYTHYFGLLVLPACLLINQLFGSRRRLFAAAVGLAALASLPWFLYILPTLQTRGLDLNLDWVYYEDGPIRAAFKMPYFFLTDIPRGANPYGTIHLLQSDRLELLLGAAAWLALAALLLAAWPALRRQWRPGPLCPSEIRWLWTTGLLVAVPILLLLVISLAFYPLLHARFVMGVLPAFWLLLALLAQLGGRRGHRLLLALFVPWLATSIAAYFVRDLPPAPMAEAARHVASQLPVDGDLLLCESIHVCAQVTWEWRHRQMQTHPVVGLGDDPFNEWPLRMHASLADTGIDLAAITRLWLFYVSDELAPLHDELAAAGFTAAGSPVPYLLLFVRDN